MRKKWIRHKSGWIWHMLLILYIAFIFSNSLTPAVRSSQESGYALSVVYGIFGRLGIPSQWLTEHIIRKCAHFTEYTGLGILLFQSSRHLGWKEEQKGRIHLAAVFFIPFVDETLQLFTEGRSGQISDVWLDMSGVIFGTALFWIGGRLLNSRRYSKKRLQERSRVEL